MRHCLRMLSKQFFSKATFTRTFLLKDDSFWSLSSQTIVFAECWSHKVILISIFSKQFSLKSSCPRTNFPNISSEMFLSETSSRINIVHFNSVPLRFSLYMFFSMHTCLSNNREERRGWFRKRAVLPNVAVLGTGEHPPKPPFWKPPFCEPSKQHILQKCSLKTFIFTNVFWNVFFQTNLLSRWCQVCASQKYFSKNSFFSKSVLRLFSSHGLLSPRSSNNHYHQDSFFNMLLGWTVSLHKNTSFR